MVKKKKKKKRKLLANALIKPSEGTQSDSCHLALHTWTCSMSPISRSSQHEILEEYAELFGLFGWLRYKQQ